MGLEEKQRVDVLDLKADPVMIGSLCRAEGILPGYHMNKAHWITVLLDGTVDTEEIKVLIEISYQRTMTPNR